MSADVGIATNNEWIQTKKRSVTELRTSTGDDAVARANMAARMAIGNSSRRKLPPTDLFGKPDFIDDAIRHVQQSLGTAGMFAQTGMKEHPTTYWCSQTILPRLPERIREALMSKDNTLVQYATAALNAAAYRVATKESLIRANEQAKEDSKSSPLVAPRIKVTQDRFTPKSSSSSSELNAALNGENHHQQQPVVEDKLSPVMERLSQAMVEKKKQAGPPRAPRNGVVSLVKEIPDSSFAREAEVLGADSNAAAATAAAAAERGPKWITKEPDFLSSPTAVPAAIETPVSPCMGEPADATIAPNDKETATPPSPPALPALVDNHHHEDDHKHDNTEQKVLLDEPVVVVVTEKMEASLKNGNKATAREEEEENSSVAEEKKAPVEEIGSESSEEEDAAEAEDDEEDEAEAREYFEQAEKQAQLEAELVNDDGIIEKDDSDEEESEVDTKDVKEIAITRAKRSAKQIAHKIIDKITEETKLKKEQQKQKPNKKKPTEQDEDDSSSSSYQASAADEEEEEESSDSSESDKQEDHKASDEEEDEEEESIAKPRLAPVAPPAHNTLPAKKKAKTETERVQETAVQVFGSRILLVKQDADIVAKAEPGRKRKAEQEQAPVAQKKAKAKPAATLPARAPSPPPSSAAKELLSDETLHAYLLTSIALYAEHFLRSEGQQSKLQRLASKAPADLTEEETEERVAFRVCFYRDKNPALRTRNSNELYKLAYQMKEHLVALKKRNPLALQDLLTVLLQPESTFKSSKLEQLTDKATIEYMRANHIIDSPISCDAQENTCLIEVTGSRPCGTVDQTPWSTELFVSGIDADIFGKIYFAAHSAEAVDQSIRQFLLSQGIPADAKDTSLTESYLASSYPDEIVTRWMDVYHHLQK